MLDRSQRHPRFERHCESVHLFTEGGSEGAFRAATASAGSSQQDRNVQRVSVTTVTVSIKFGSVEGEDFVV